MASSKIKKPSTGLDSNSDFSGSAFHQRFSENRRDKIGYVELAVLGFLSTEALHGYEIHRRIENCFGSVITASWGSIYPALSRLESRGFINEHDTSDNKRLDTPPILGSLAAEYALLGRRSTPSRRQRKVYKATSAGKAALDSATACIDGSDAREFVIGYAFTPKKDLEARKRLLTNRLAVLREELNRIPATTGLLLAPVRFRLEAEIRWCQTELEQLITRVVPDNERKGS
jgi:DNA-binding PadR family transcriptional regulator